MSIPLVQDNEKDSINTSIIAIKRYIDRINQLLGLSDSGTTIINNESDSGIPLGTWASFENDIAPSEEWLEAGATFNTGTYSALALMVGGNTVPWRFDHNRPSDYESIVLPSSSANALTAEYDGEIIYTTNNDTATVIFINGVQVTNPGVRSSYGKTTATFSVKKGDVFYVTVTNGIINTDNEKVRWYKHPLFIKATPTSVNSDYEGVLSAVYQYQRDQDELSDYESITIGKSAANATTMQYDGFINIIANSTGTLYVYLNGETLIYYRLSGASYCDLPVMIAVKKGDVIYTNNVTTSASKARFYKKRDYSGR